VVIIFSNQLITNCSPVILQLDPVNFQLINWTFKHYSSSIFAGIRHFNASKTYTVQGQGRARASLFFLALALILKG